MPPAQKSKLDAPSAIHRLAEIKAVTEAFDRGEINLFDALDEIVLAVEAYQAAARPQVRREAA